MRCIKTVTPRKIEANRKNAKRSTEPRTDRGKSIAKFNAVTLGLFAKHVVIPICDGYRPEKEFQTLLDGLHQDFHPVGFYEEWLVVKIAECMWRLRRATRCESGSVRGFSKRSDQALSAEQDRIDQAEGCHERTPVWTVRTPRHRERLEGNTVYQGIRYIAVLAATPTSALAFSAVLIALLGTKSMSSFRTETS
jgi:hypothetical protein